jgi:hypothetical protein
MKLVTVYQQAVNSVPVGRLPASWGLKEVDNKYYQLSIYTGVRLFILPDKICPGREHSSPQINCKFLYIVFLKPICSRFYPFLVYRKKAPYLLSREKG